MRTLLAALLALAVAAPAADARPPARMLVTADEWMLISSRQSIQAGRVQVQLYNRGEDAHDIAARRVDRLGRRVGRTWRIGETRPGELGEATWRLRPGRYRLWCTLRSHEAAGMRARLRAR
jgi:plastocyanin